MNIGQNIKVLRRNNRISQEKLAGKMQVSRQVISKWENKNNDPPINDIVMMAKIFGVTLEELILGNIEEVGFNFEKNIEKVKKLRGAHSDNKKEDDVDNKRVVPLINPENLDSYKAFKQAYKLNISMENTDDISDFVEMMTLYEKAFKNGIIEAGVNILNVVVGFMMNIKNNTPEHELIFDDVLIQYIEELEEVRHPAGEFFRAYALSHSLIDNEKSEEENLDDGMIMMYTIAHNGNKYAKNLINYIENLVDEE